MSNIDPNGKEAWILQQAQERPLAERAAFLDGACAGDVALRRRLEARMLAHEQFSRPNTRAREDAPPTLTAASADRRPDEAVGQTLGRYRLLEKIGEGGCGVVYVAEQTEPVRRRVALKVIKLGMDTKAVVARFEAERQALAMMDHPNVAKVLDAGTTDVGRPYFVMELVRGIKITDYCDQSQLTTKDRLNLFMRVCQAIQHAHQKGIIHRDIKPSNILVTLHDGVPVPKVIDFGIAKATEGRLADVTVYTQLHQFIGTPAYMSPEQAEMSGLDIDTRSDIYSLGVLLYELLTGRTPFDARELMAQGIDAMRKTIREREPAPPSTRLATLQGEELTTTAKRRAADTAKLLHQLRGDLDWIVMKCLEKDRTRRYETASGLAMDLHRHLTNQPVVARPPTAAYRFQKLFRRNKLVFTAATAVAAALVAGVGVSTWQAVEARNAQRESEAARSQEQQQRLEAERQRRAAEASAAREREQRSRVEALAYATDMNLTLRALEMNDLGRARALLNRNRPLEGEPDRRGWEWRYLWNRSRSDEITTLGSHGHHVTSLAFSPVGDVLVSGSWDGKLGLWNWKERRSMGELDVGGRVQATVFSPDGRWLAVRRNGLGCQIWDLAARRPIAELKDALQGGVRGPVAFSPQGDLLAISADDGMIKLWKPNTQVQAGAVPGRDDLVTAIVFSWDGKKLFSSGDMRDPSVRVWDLSGQREVALLRGHTAWTTSLALSPSAPLLASTSGDGTVRIWDLSLQQEKLVLTNNAPLAWDAKFSADGRLLATCGADQRIRLWDTATWEPVRVFKGHLNEVWCLAFSPDGKELASGGKDDTVRLWRAETAPETPAARLFPPRTFGATGSLSVDGRWFATVSGNRITLGDTRTLRDLRDFVLDSSPTPNANPTAALIDPRRQRLYLGYADGRVRAVDLSTNLEATSLTGHGEQVDLLALSPDGTRLASASRDRSVHVQDAATGQPLLSLSEAEVSLDCLRFSRDGLLLAGGWARQDKILLWDLRTGALRFRMTGHKDRIVGLDFSPDGRQLASGSWDGTAGLWDLATGQRLATLRAHLLGVNTVAFTADGQRLAGGTGDGLIKVWSVTDYQEILTLTGHSDINTLTFLPDETLVSVTPQSIQLWPAPALDQIDQTERAGRRLP